MAQERGAELASSSASGCTQPGRMAGSLLRGGGGRVGWKLVHHYAREMPSLPSPSGTIANANGSCSSNLSWSSPALCQRGRTVRAGCLPHPLDLAGGWGRALWPPCGRTSFCCHPYKLTTRSKSTIISAQRLGLDQEVTHDLLPEYSYLEWICTSSDLNMMGGSHRGKVLLHLTRA